MAQAFRQTVLVKKNKLPMADAKTRAALAAAIAKAALDIERTSKQLTPPRIDHGDMVNGWRSEPESQLVWVVYNNQEHSIYNEFGTRRMAPHPMIRPAAAQGFQKLMAGLMKELPEVFRL